MTPTLQHFETFLAVAEYGSFTKAAKQTGKTKASVSQTIRLLEDSLKLPLFIRSTRSVRLTDEGKLLFDQCKRLHSELNVTRELINGFNLSPAGVLRISCNPYFAESYLLNILQEYCQRFPKVKIEVLAEERMPNMQQEQIDIVLGVNWPAPEDIVAKEIGFTRYVLCASPAYLKKHGIPKNLKALEKHRYIPHYGRSPENRVTGLKKETVFNFSPQLTVNNAHIMKKCALYGLGIVQLHDYIVSEELNEGYLVEILPEYFKTQIPLYVYYQKFKFVQPKIRQFIQLLEKRKG